jgi:hypothetical protein
VVVVVVPGAAVVVVPGAAVVVVVDVGLVALATATFMNASMLRSAIAKDTTTGPTNAPVPINRFRVLRLPSSSPLRAPLKTFSSPAIHATLAQSTLMRSFRIETHGMRRSLHL